MRSLCVVLRSLELLEDLTHLVLFGGESLDEVIDVLGFSGRHH